MCFLKLNVRKEVVDPLSDEPVGYMTMTETTFEPLELTGDEQEQIGRCKSIERVLADGTTVKARAALWRVAAGADGTPRPVYEAAA
ncbi:hypothetical protein [Capillimicrobium parvum]|uniref:hypothetical protein n=1 Tax=Capillimicrobium parvum TaxID=2884022 RepID=UPI00216ABEE9|nr:hypothetical protein [Capillimicrobium parvum]